MGTLKIGQKKIIGIGEIYEAFITSLPLLSAVQFISILAILYTDLKPYLVGLLPGITLFRFLVVLTFIMLGVMVLVYKFLIPSIWTFRGKQLHGFESTLLDEVKKLRKEIQDMKKEENDKDLL